MADRHVLRLALTTWICGSLLFAQQPSRPQTKAALQKATLPDDSNFVTCTRGSSGCDVSALTPDQLKKVTEAVKTRNLSYCMEGGSLCDPTRLTATEASA